MKTRRLAFILLILGGVLFLAEARLHDSGRMSKSPRRPPSLWSPPIPARGSKYPQMKFVDPPMPPVPPGPPPSDRDRRR